MNELRSLNSQDVMWVKAATLAERIATLRAHKPEASNSQINQERAVTRIKRWREQSPFTDEKYFVQWLETNNLTEDEFLYLLGESEETLFERLIHTPAWLRDFELAFWSSDQGSENGTSPFKRFLGETQKLDGFLAGIEPLLRRGREHLRRGILGLQENYSFLPFDVSAALDMFCSHLPELLSRKVTRTLILELNVARVQGDLKGETPAERFQDFNERLTDRNVLLHILQEYPVLTRQIIETIEQWAEFSLEVLERLCGDWEAIQKFFSPENDPGLLSHVSASAGDMHRRGRSVKILTFASGFQLVYKPRSLSVDLHFGDLLTWLNERGANPPFRLLKVIDRTNYGWVEFISANECSTKEGVRQFYERQGGFLALFYVLEATDFHHENLIASGEDPVMVDLEALFHPRLRYPQYEQVGLALAGNAIEHSVLRVGLLPRRLWAVDEAPEGLEMSGLGGKAGQLTPFPVIAFENLSTDEMRVVRKRVRLSGSKNRPSLNGTALDAEDFIDAILAGFSSTYRLLMKHRDELLGDDGLLSSFAEDEIRVVLRPTRNYATLLSESYHPDVLRDALDRDRLFDRVWNGIALDSMIKRVIPFEIADLQRGDVPVFSSRPDSRHLWTSQGELIKDFFEEPSMKLVEQKLRDLCEEDLSRQIWFVNASMTTLVMGESQSSFVRSDLEESQQTVTRQQLIEAALAVGDRLETLALSDGENVNWIGVTIVAEKTWTLLPLADDIYSGTLGIALFLAHLGEVGKEKRYTSIAQKVVANLRKRIENAPGAPGAREGLGGYSGIGAVIYTLTHVGVLWDEPSLLKLAESLIGWLPKMINEDELLDLLSGSAGCIANLLSLHRVTSSEQALLVARQCADHIIARSEPMPQGIAWRTRVTADRPLTGLSHGAAGISYSLLEIAALTGDDRYKKAALGAITYEQSVFSTEQQNWPDYRGDLSIPSGLASERVVCMCTWCHGAPGIGLARVRALKHLDDESIHNEIDIALKTTLSNGLGLNHSLCHGDLGNVEFLYEAANALNDSRLKARVSHLSAALLSSMKKKGWLCGTPRAVETPGLMTGLAGIGYGLLRLAEPDRVPSILTLAPPYI